jgi:hypothetical protein
MFEPVQCAISAALASAGCVAQPLLTRSDRSSRAAEGAAQRTAAARQAAGWRTSSLQKKCSPGPALTVMACAATRKHRRQAARKLSLRSDRHATAVCSTQAATRQKEWRAATAAHKEATAAAAEPHGAEGLTAVLASRWTRSGLPLLLLVLAHQRTAWHVPPQGWRTAAGPKL